MLYTITDHMQTAYLTLSFTVLTHYQTTNFRLDSSKLKEFADDNFEFDENGRKLSKQVENTVRNGEIACYEQFLLFQQFFFFKRIVSLGRQKVSLCWNGLICFCMLKINTEMN